MLELSARFDKLAERNGVSSPELGVDASVQHLFSSARVAGLDREAVDEIVEKEFDRVFGGKQSIA